MTTEKCLAVGLPHEVAMEISELPSIGKSLLMHELSDRVLEAMDGLLILDLSATTTQWLKSLTTLETLQLVQNLSLMLMSEVKR